VVTLIDRLVERAEIVFIQSESYRRKESQEYADQKAKHRNEKAGGPYESLSSNFGLQRGELVDRK
jgi:hypothetical protein